MERGVLQEYIQASCFYIQKQCQACWNKLFPTAGIKLNRQRTGVGRFHSSMYKWVLAPTPNCECGASEETTDHVLTAFPMHRAPHGARGLMVLDEET